MAFIAFGVIWLGYLLGWDGYATLQQPTGPNPDGVGIVDLILPSRISKVDLAIQHNWFKNPAETAPGATIPGPGYKGPKCPDGSNPIYVTPSGQPICGTIA